MKTSKSTPKRYTTAPPVVRKSKQSANRMSLPKAVLPTARSKVASARDSMLPVSSVPSDSDIKAGETSRLSSDTPPVSAVSPALINQIRERCARRNAAMSACTRITNQTKALVRRFLGWQTHLKDADRTAIKELAGQIVKAVEKRKVADLSKELQDVAVMVAEFIQHAQQAKIPFTDIKEKEETELEKLAEQLPGADFVKSVKGFGLIKFAQIIGETGDLSGYSNPGKLWKRMGLAPYKGKSPSTWKMTKNSGITAEDWIAMGYVQTRRALMFVIGDCLIKCKEKGKYQKVYYDRKAYEIAREPDIKPIIAHRRAHRIMVKNLLKHLWQAWRGQPASDEYVKA